MDQSPSPLAAHLDVRELSFAYAPGAKRALDQVSLRLAAGEFAVLSGRNGAGKSTLALALNGTIPHLIRGGECSGEVLLDGKKVDSPRQMASAVGVIFQDFEAHLVASSAALEVAFTLENIGVQAAEQRRRVTEQLSLVGLKGFEERFPAELSGGEKQRLAVAAAIAPSPGLLVLDEPLTDLDPIGKEVLLEIIARLKSAGVTVLMIEHDPQAVLAADRLLVLREGRLAYDGDAMELLALPAECRKLGVPVWAPAEVAESLGLKCPSCSVEDVARGIAQARPITPRSPASSARRREGGEPALTVQGLTSGYPAGPDVLHDVNLEVGKGECLALLGQNGSGKTALAKHAVGLIKARKGRIAVAGRPVAEYSMGDLSRQVGYVFQNPDHQIFSDTVYEEVAFGVRNLGASEMEVSARVKEALRAVGLEGADAADPFSLARGERQRLAVASMLAYRPGIIFFDEPTTGLDAVEAQGMMSFIKELNGQGLTVVLITHAMWAAAEYAERVAVMNQGRIVLAGPVEEVFADEAALRALSLTPPPAALLANRLGISARGAGELLAALRSES